MAVGDSVVRIFVPVGEHIWIAPSVAVVFSLYLMHRLFFREGRSPGTPALDPPPGETIRGPHMRRINSTAGVG
jgi:hypothetical protein